MRHRVPARAARLAFRRLRRRPSSRRSSGRLLEIAARCEPLDALCAPPVAVPFVGIVVHLKRGEALPIFGLLAMSRRRGRPIGRRRGRALEAHELACQRTSHPRRHPCLRGADASLCVSGPHAGAHAAGPTDFKRYDLVERRCRFSSTTSAAPNLPFSTFIAAAMPARNIARSLITARKRTPRLPSASARSGV